MLGYENPEWMERGRCRGIDPNLFYSTESEDIERAIGVCATCEVVDKCLDYALDTRQDHGVWGGTSEKDRRAIIKERRSEKTDSA